MTTHHRIAPSHLSPLGNCAVQGIAPPAPRKATPPSVTSRSASECFSSPLRVWRIAQQFSKRNITECYGALNAGVAFAPLKTPQNSNYMQNKPDLQSFSCYV